jgi:hypothetical protein
MALGLDNREHKSVSESGMSWSNVAASAYRAYAASTGNKNFRGEPMPEFSQLPQAIKVAWEAAVRQVGDCLRSKVTQAPDESHWAGWLPPQYELS